MEDNNPNQPVTERLCQERQKHVQVIQDDLKGINSKLDGVQVTLTELSTEMKTHVEGHEKGWNKGYAIVMCLIALAATVIAMVTLALNHRQNSDEATPKKTSQLQRIPKEIEIVHYQA